MAENDIYNSKSKYERFRDNLDKLLIPPDKRQGKYRSISKYYCKNIVNLEYYKILFNKFESKDLSYVRRLRVLAQLKIITYVTDKDLISCEREDIEKIMSFMHSVYPSKKSKEDFIRDIKYLWKQLFPEKDEKGRIDESLIPYTVRYISNRIEKAKAKIKISSILTK